jgi:type II secretory pathway pseudopilin PulG
MKITHQKGYTITEVLIVISISTAMFAIVAATFGGRQEEVQFNQAIRDFEATIQDNMNDVSTGYFDNPGGITCSVAGAGSRPSIGGGGGSPQGTNEDCVFVGKVMQFAPSGGTSYDSKANIYTALGRRETSAGTAPTTIAESLPRMLVTNPVNQYELPWGLRVTRVVADNASSTDYGGVGFFTQFNSTSGTNTLSGGQAIRYGGIDGTNLNMAQNSFITQADNITDVSPAGSNNRVPIIICVENPAGNRRGAIIIGGDGNSNTRLEFAPNRNAKCGP